MIVRSLAPNSARIKELLPLVARSNSAADLIIYTQQAEDYFLLKVLGQQFYDEFDAFLSMPNVPLSPIQTKLIGHIEKAVANCAMVAMLKDGNVLITDSGTAEITGSNAMPARQWAVIAAIENASKKADDYLESLTAFLFSNANATELATWKESNPFTRTAPILLKTASDFSIACNREIRWHLFQSCFLDIQDSQDESIGTAFGFEFLDTLLAWTGAETPDPPLTPRQLAAISFAKRAVATATLAKVLPRQLFQIDNSGIRTFYTSDGISTKNMATPEEADRYCALLREESGKALYNLKNLVKGAPEQFTSYTPASAAYKSNITSSPNGSSIMFRA